MLIAALLSAAPLLAAAPQTFLLPFPDGSMCKVKRPHEP